MALPADQARVSYEQFAELAEKLPDGLPPGEYVLRIEGSAESSNFTVEDADWRAEVMRRPDRFAELTCSRTNPLYLQVLVETLFEQHDEDGKPFLYLSDALDALESVPEPELSTHLRQWKADVARRLAGEEPRQPETLEDLTGIEQIDAARRSIAAGNWGQALQSLLPPSCQRIRARGDWGCCIRG